MEGGSGTQGSVNPALLEAVSGRQTATPEGPVIHPSAPVTIPKSALAVAKFVDRALRKASDLVTPPTLGPVRIRVDAWCLYVCAVVGVAVAMKIVSILDGAITMTNSDGASRLFVAIDRFGDPDYFRELSTWLGQPMPVPQIYYTLLYAVDRLTGGAVPVTVTALLMNSLFYAAAVLILALVARRIGGAPSGAIFALFAVSAHTPNFISMTAAVEPSAILFFSAGLWLCAAALTASRPLLFAVWGGVALALASAIRLEYFVVYPIISLLLYSKLGFARCAVFTATALSYAFLYQAGGQAFGDIIPYTDLSAYYGRAALSLDQFLRSALFVSGIQLTWGPYVLALLAIAACYALASREHRLLGLLALGAMLFLVGGALAGRFGAGQPRYATLALLLLALPAATVVARNVRISRGLGVIVLAVAGAVSLASLNNVIALRAASPPVQVKQMEKALLSRLAPGDATFFDYSTGFYDYAMGLVATTKSRAAAFAYPTRCCVSDGAVRRLGAAEVKRLTSDKGMVMPALTTSEKLMSFQIWAHGFVERHRPKYFVLERGKRSRVLAKARGWPRNLSSTIWPFATRASDDPKSLNVRLRYADVEFKLKPVAHNGWYTLYEATY